MRKLKSRTRLNDEANCQYESVSQQEGFHDYKNETSHFSYIATVFSLILALVGMLCKESGIKV